MQNCIQLIVPSPFGFNSRALKTRLNSTFNRLDCQWRTAISLTSEIALIHFGHHCVVKRIPTEYRRLQTVNLLDSVKWESGGGQRGSDEGNWGQPDEWFHSPCLLYRRVLLITFGPVTKLGKIKERISQTVLGDVSQTFYYYHWTANGLSTRWQR
jgi:hypothetical protein